MGGKVLFTLFVSIATVQCASLRSGDEHHSRVARSPCSTCDNAFPPAILIQPPPFPPPPPPPPPHPAPYFRTQQWSGVARTNDGSQHGVFSGAAASLDGPSQSAGEAYSLAASSAGTDTNAGYGNQNAGQQSGKYSSSEFSHGSNQVGGINGNEQQQGSSGSGAGAEAQSSSFSASGVGNGATVSHQQSGYLGRGDQNDQQIQSQGNSNYGSKSAGESQSFGHGSQKSQGYGNGYNENQQAVSGSQAQSSSYGQGNTQGFGNGSPRGFNGNQQASSDESQSQYSSHDEQRVQGLGSPRDYSNNQQALSAGSQSQGKATQLGSSEQYREDEHSQGSRTSGQDDIQSTFHGALNLANQGLQTAQQQPCTTCGKSSYALSNARSNSGSAVALSIGG